MEILYSEYFSYDPQSPSFLKCNKDIGRKKMGEYPSVKKHHSGYLVISILTNKIQLHRLVWELNHGKIPDGFCVDHIDGNKNNNLIENLRLATLSQNSWNRKKQTNGNPLLPKGICIHKSGGYRAYIQKNGRRWGRYSKNLSELTSWLDSMRAKLHGSYANYG
ncbi:HNH endonuclease [Phytobacter diazotrophicus]|uniref:HNH endonuclease n=1 Tax=Phytobacter diazotrophicus TaxID=395631 RepID=UPI002FF055DF